MKLAVSGKSYEKGHEQTDRHQNIINVPALIILLSLFSEENMLIYQRCKILDIYRAPDKKE